MCRPISYIHNNFSLKVDILFFDDPVLLRADFKRKGKVRPTEHFNGSDETIEVILRMVITVNHLSMYGAVAAMCGDLAWEVSRSS